MKRLIILALTALTLSSCIDFGENKIRSTGSPYEIILVTTQARWNSALGDTLRSILLRPVEMINQVEPIFDVYFMKPEGFTGIVEKNQNVVSVRVDAKDFPEPQILAQFDVYASPQIFITLAGPSESAITQYVSEHRDVLVEYLEQAHRDRYLANIKKYNVKSINKLVSDKFGFQMNVPKGYTVRSEKPNFLWLSFEYPQASQGVVIYSAPYTDKQSFSLDSLVARDNRYLSLIPGPSDGSYMTTNPEFMPEVEYLRIYGRFWARLGGFWDVKGDFMGGPFTSYSTLDTKTNRVITIYTYLYSPKQHKRNYLRELQSLVYGITFPGDETLDAEKN